MRTEETAVADPEGMTDEELAASQADLDADGPYNDDDGGAPAPQRRTLADLASEEPEAEPEIEQFTLFGTGSKLNGNVKGGKVKESAVSIGSAAKDLPGQFDLDDVIEVRALLRVDGVDIRTRRDKDGQLMTTKRIHKTTLVDVEQMDHVPDDFAGSEIDGRGMSAEQLRETIERLQGQLDRVEGGV